MQKGLKYAKIRSRHSSHNVLRKAKQLRFLKPVIIRLGSSTAGQPGDIEINTVQAIKNCSDKLLMKELFAKAKVKSPNFFNVEEVLKTEVKYPLVKKLKFRSRGQGMQLVNNKQELDKIIAAKKDNIYFEEYFNGSREYRLHVSEEGCFYTCRKMRKKDAKERWFFNSQNCVWMLEDNVLFNKPPTFDKIVEECKKGLKALGLDFAAFDVRVGKDGTFTIIEANSAPSFAEITTQKYLEHLPILINKKIGN
jgi:glutathione synthase/RimK-type ligase-like ATP-grasp enzyme